MDPIDVQPLRRSTDLPPPKIKQTPFHPKILTTLKGYTRAQFNKDAVAGVIVGIVALPLAIAFAIASGVTPDRGIVTAIVAGFLISALGGSRVQIGGPTGAFVIIVYGIVEKYGVQGLTTCTLMAGVMLVLMGLLQLGTVIKYIPYPLTVGFTSGIAVIIFSSQIKDFFGLQTGALPSDFTDKWNLYFHTLATFDYRTLLLSIFSIGIILFWPKIDRKIPGSMIAIILITALVQIFGIHVETIGSRFGSIPTVLPTPVWPHLSIVEMKNLIAPAFTVAMLGAIESLLSATVADSMIEGRHRSNTELVAPGVANIVSPLFGGIPATGAIARTATNVKNGARTPVAGIVHAITLLLMVMVFGRWVKFIPMCVLAAILVAVSYHMSEFRAFKGLLRAPKMDIAVLFTTFLLTVLVDLTVAVEIGMLLSLVLFMKRMTDVSAVRQVNQELVNPTDEEAWREREDSVSIYDIPEGVEVYQIEGALFFGVASTLRDNLQFGKTPPKALILRLKYVYALDASGIQALVDIKRTCERQRIVFIIEGLNSQPRYALEKAGFLKEFGRQNQAPSFEQALQRANEVLGKKNE